MGQFFSQRSLAQWWRLLAAMLAVACLMPAALQAADDYRVDVGDTITILVYGEPDLDVKEVKVTARGHVAVPLVGDIKVRGRTEAQILQDVTARLADGYLKNPNVTVSVDRLQLYYIKGEVRKPGGYRYVEGMSVDKAIALAGGFTERAAEDDIRISTGNEASVRKNISLSTPVKPGDVITVGESFF